MDEEQAADGTPEAPSRANASAEHSATVAATPLSADEPPTLPPGAREWDALYEQWQAETPPPIPKQFSILSIMLVTTLIACDVMFLRKYGWHGLPAVAMGFAFLVTVIFLAEDGLRMAFWASVTSALATSASLILLERMLTIREVLFLPFLGFVFGLMCTVIMIAATELCAQILVWRKFEPGQNDPLDAPDPRLPARRRVIACLVACLWLQIWAVANGPDPNAPQPPTMPSSIDDVPEE